MRRKLGEAIIWVFKRQIPSARLDRVKKYQSMLAARESFYAQAKQEAGGNEEEYCIEVLTQLKYGYCTKLESLTREEKDVMLTAFDRVAEMSGTIVMCIPSWFASSPELALEGEGDPVWQGAFVGSHHSGSTETEESFLGQVVVWQGFNYPQIIKFYAACHVGKRFFICEATSPPSLYRISWEDVRQYILDLHYLRQCGASHRGLSFDSARKTLHGRIALLGSDIVMLEADMKDDSLVMNILWIAEIALTSILLRRQPRDAHAEAIQAMASRERPAVVTDSEWTVLQAMVSVDPNGQNAMLDIVHLLSELVDTPEACLPCVFSDQRLYEVEIEMATQLGGVFEKLREIFESTEGAHESNRRVFQRLVDLFEQLYDRACSSLPNKLVKDFIAIVTSFRNSTQSQCSMSFCSAYSSIGSVRTNQDQVYSYHRDIDRLLAYREVVSDSPVHDWDDVRELKQNHLCPFEGFSSDNEENKSRSTDLDGEAMIALFEATKCRGAYSPFRLKGLELRYQQVQPSIEPFSLPTWFIPPYEVELGSLIDKGSFGSAYHGTWFDTPQRGSSLQQQIAVSSVIVLIRGRIDVSSSTKNIQWPRVLKRRVRMGDVHGEWRELRLAGRSS